MTPHKSLDQLFEQGMVVNLGGATHKMAKLTNKDFAEFVADCKAVQLKAFYATMNAVPPARQAEVIYRIQTDSWSDGRMIEQGGTCSGAMWLVGRALANASEEIDAGTLEHVDLMDAATVVMVVSGILSKDALLAFEKIANADSWENPTAAGGTNGDQSSPK